MNSQVGRGARVANLQTQQRQRLEADLAAQKMRDRENKVDDRVWVCCNKCDKWRALPASTNTKELPDIWICEYNTADPARSTCDDPEEVYVQQDAEVKSFLKVWYVTSSLLSFSFSISIIKFMVIMIIILTQVYLYAYSPSCRLHFLF